MKVQQFDIQVFNIGPALLDRFPECRTEQGRLQDTDWALGVERQVSATADPWRPKIVLIGQDLLLQHTRQQVLCSAGYRVNCLPAARALFVAPAPGNLTILCHTVDTESARSIFSIVQQIDPGVQMLRLARYGRLFSESQFFPYVLEQGQHPSVLLSTVSEILAAHSPQLGTMPMAE